MDLVSPIDYREIIKQIIGQYADLKPSYGDVQVEAIYDEKTDHYELIYAGWDGPRRIHGSVIHVDIRDGLIWIQHDGTEAGIADELIAAGIPRERIVLAFHPPRQRKHTPFATGCDGPVALPADCPR
jgi:hypothetical protein